MHTYTAVCKATSYSARDCSGALNKDRSELTVPWELTRFSSSNYHIVEMLSHSVMTKLGFLVDLGGCLITPLGAGRLLTWQFSNFRGGGGSLLGGGGSLIRSDQFSLSQKSSVLCALHSDQSSKFSSGGPRGWLMSPGYTLGVVVGAAKSNYWIFCANF